MNGGHGHVFPRQDGFRARCGGPGLCSRCNAERDHKERIEAARAQVLDELARRQASSLESYFRETLGKGQIDHVLRARIDEKGCVVFYIHPSGVSGTTMDFRVFGNALETLWTSKPT